MADSNAITRLKKRRYSRACTRCRKRKIRVSNTCSSRCIVCLLRSSLYQCDFQYPSCGACSAIIATCLGFDLVQRIPAPRSSVLHLEGEVARLEQELQHARDQKMTRQDADANKITARLAAVALEPRIGLSKQECSLPLTSRFFLSASPAPFLDREAWDNTEPSLPDHRPSNAMTVSSIPRNTAVRMLKHYCEIYRPQYPATEEVDLYQSFDRVYDNAKPSNFDILCVHITLAISVCTRSTWPGSRSELTTLDHYTYAPR